MHADKKPKLNTRHKSNKLDVDFDFEERNIRDKYREMYRILFQDTSIIKEHLSKITVMAQNIIKSADKPYLKDIKEMYNLIQNINKDFEYYIDPNDIQGEDVVSETNVNNIISHMNDTIKILLENFKKGVDINNIQNIQNDVNAIIDVLAQHEKRIEYFAQGLITNLKQRVDLKDEEDELIDNINTWLKETIKDRFKNNVTPFLKDRFKDLHLVRYIIRVLKRNFHDIKNAIIEDSVFKNMSINKTDEIISKLSEFINKNAPDGTDDAAEKFKEVTKEFVEEIYSSIENSESPEEDTTEHPEEDTIEHPESPEEDTIEHPESPEEDTIDITKPDISVASKILNKLPEIMNTPI